MVGWTQTGMLSWPVSQQNMFLCFHAKKPTKQSNSGCRNCVKDRRNHGNHLCISLLRAAKGIFLRSGTTLTQVHTQIVSSKVFLQRSLKLLMLYFLSSFVKTGETLGVTAVGRSSFILGNAHICILVESHMNFH